MSKKQMPVQMNEWEQRALYRKMTELNNKLDDIGMKKIEKEAYIVHKLIELGLHRLKLSESGSLIID